jgi:hypothetical protein
LFGIASKADESQTFGKRVRLGKSERERVTEMTQIADADRSERAKVESWRLHVLIEAGFPVSLAEKLAHSEADLHRAVEMVAAGCRPETAVEILL